MAFVTMEDLAGLGSYATFDASGDGLERTGEARPLAAETGVLPTQSADLVP